MAQTQPSDGRGGLAKRGVNSERSHEEQKAQSLVNAPKYVKVLVLYGCKKFRVLANVYFRREEKTRACFSPQQTLPPPLSSDDAIEMELSDWLLN